MSKQANHLYRVQEHFISDNLCILIKTSVLVPVFKYMEPMHLLYVDAFMNESKHCGLDNDGFPI